MPQPPIKAALRSREHHGFWPAGIVVGLGIALAGVGAVRPTAVPTTEGRAASELQLTRACSFNGLQYVDQLPPPPEPPQLDNTAKSAGEFERWAQQQADVIPPGWKVRIDPRAATRCPT